jgi:hypothetical protein
MKAILLYWLFIFLKQPIVRSEYFGMFSDELFCVKCSQSIFSNCSVNLLWLGTTNTKMLTADWSQELTFMDSWKWTVHFLSLLECIYVRVWLVLLLFPGMNCGNVLGFGMHHFQQIIWYQLSTVSLLKTFVRYRQDLLLDLCSSVLLCYWKEVAS